MEAGSPERPPEGARHAEETQGAPQEFACGTPGARIPERAPGEGVGRARDRPSPRRGARARYSAAEGSAMEGSLIVRLVSGAVLGRVPKRGLYPAVLFAKVVRTLSDCEKYFLFPPLFFLVAHCSNLKLPRKRFPGLPGAFPSGRWRGGGVCFLGAKTGFSGAWSVALGLEMSCPNLRPRCRDSDPVSD